MKFAHSPILSQRVPAWRGRFVLLLLLTGFAGLVARSFYLQAVNNDFLQKKGESRYERVIDMSATRGRIVDRHGDVLAVSTAGEVDLGDSRRCAAVARPRARSGAVARDGRARDQPQAGSGQGLRLRQAPDPAGRGGAGGGPESARHTPAARIPPLLPVGRCHASHVLGFTGVEDCRPGRRRAGLEPPSPASRAAGASSRIAAARSSRTSRPSRCRRMART